MRNPTKAQIRRQFDYVNDGPLRRRTSENRWARGLKVRGSLYNHGYRCVYFMGKTNLIHRLIFIWHYGRIKGEIDHINGIRDDNRIQNLRDATRSQNISNLTKPRKNKYGIKGLNFRKNRWVGAVAFENRRYEVSSKNRKTVIKKLNILRERLHGEFGRT